MFAINQHGCSRVKHILQCAAYALLGLALSACKSAPVNQKAELEAFKTSLGVRQAWQVQLGKAREANFQPVLVGAALFTAGSDTVYRLNIESGKSVWQTKIGRDLSAGVGADAQVIAVATRKGEVIALDAENGKELWRSAITSEVVQPPVVGQGLVVVRSQDNRIHAFEIKDGKRRWTYQRQVPSLTLRAFSGLLIADGLLYAGMPGGRLVALTLNNGSPRWEVPVAQPKGTTELERIADVVGVPVLQDRSICAVAYQGRLSCFDVGTGQTSWTRDVSSTSGLTLDQRFVFVTDEKSVVHAFARMSGSSVWRNSKLSYRDVSAPVSVGRAVVVGDSDGYVHWLGREDGAMLARLRPDSSPIQAAPLATDLGVIVQNRSGTLTAYHFE